MTFRAKLTIALLSVALIPALIVGLLSFDSYKKTIETAHLSGLANITSYKADKIETYFSGLRTGIWIAQGTFAVKNNLPVLTRFSSNTDNAEFISAKQQIDETVRRMQKAFDLLDIMLVDPEGKIVYSSDPAGGQKNFLKALSDPQQKAFEEGKRAVYFTDIFPDDPENKKLVMLITAPAFDPKDVFAGVIVFKADMVPIYKLIGDIRGLGKTGESSTDFAKNLLLQQKVALVPGVAFGQCWGQHVRISYASSYENLKEAVARIERYLKKK